MSNYYLWDKNLSLKAKGLLSFMLSLPDDLDYSLQRLVAICKESKDVYWTVFKLFDTQIPKTVKAAGYTKTGESILSYDKNSRVVQSYSISFAWN